MPKQILTIKQAAKLLQVDPNTIYRWARSGKFPGSKIGKEWRVLHSDVIKFIESNKKRAQFLSESQEAELITALVGRREIPLKFEYMGKGAERYVALSFPNVGGGSEFDIFLDNKTKLISFLGKSSFNLLDLGSGDGKKAAFFINNITKNTSGYFALDISSRMLDIAISNIELSFPNLPHEAFIGDFENGNIAQQAYYLHRRYQKNNLILFLGNTIGNLSDAHRVLINLRDSMTEDDYLLVGLAFYNANNIPLDSYNSEKVKDWLWSIPQKIGITSKDSKIYASYNKQRRQIEMQLEFNKDWEQAYGMNFLSFNEKQRIRLAISRRFTKDDIFELFAGAGFKIELLTHDKDNALVLVRPHTWEKKI